MNQTVELLTLNLDADRALPLITQLLARLGLQVLPSFDLRTARHAFVQCSCPHHGTEQCDCQMVVLLLYGRGGSPTTLVLHGHDGRTFLSLVDTPQQRTEAELPSLIRQFLLENIPS